MEIKIIAVDIINIDSDAVLVSLFEGTTNPTGATGTVDKALGGWITNLIAAGEITGKYGELTTLHSMDKIPARIISVVGLGKKAEFTIDRLRSIMAQACRNLRKSNCQKVATVLHSAGVGDMDVALSAQAIVEGSLLGLYEFHKHKTRGSEHKDIQTLIITEQNDRLIKVIEDGCSRGEILAESVILARDMVNEPSNYMTPNVMAGIAASLAKQHELELAILDTAKIKEENMGALLGVAQGSEQPPKFIVLKYKGNPSSPETIGFVGKGITFDSGGISLKPSENMGDMKGDMAGGATVMAALVAITKLKLKLNVTAFIPATENLPSGTAIKPGDVLTALNGKTIEIISTDAEGRLILADALSYAVKQGVSKLIDVATLTGACHIALGSICSGVFSNNQDLADKLVNAGVEAGECMWQMPMNEEYKELNNSDVADIKNSGGRWGGAITAAQFLSEFVADVPWVHIDIAGTSDTDKEKGYFVKGATGVGVRTLVHLAMALVDNK